MSGNAKKGHVNHRHKLAGLNPDFRAKVERVLRELIDKGYPMRIVWGRRTQEENDRLHEEGKAIKNSKHLRGKALDIIHRIHAYRSTPENRQFWEDLRIAAEKQGLIWGGRFERYDPTHIEAKEPNE